VKWLLLLMVTFLAAGAGLLYAAHTGADELPGTYTVSTTAGPGTAEITDGRVTVTVGDTTYSGNLLLTAARKTEPVDLKAVTGPDAGTFFPAVARFVRGELTLVLGEKGERPLDITATGDGVRRLVLTKTGSNFVARAGRTLGGIVANLGNPDAWKATFERPEVYWPAVAVLALIIFAETGLLVGFFLPGDSLLVTVGIVARVVGWDILPLLAILCVAAVIGDTVGYWVGAKGGPAIFRRPESRWFKHDHLVAAKGFFDRHGGKTLIIARFMPFARTFVPVVAGAAKMNYSWFLTYNVIGGVAWIISMLLFGYTATLWLDPLLKGIFGDGFKLEKNIDILALVIIALSVAPMAIHWLIVRGKTLPVPVAADPTPGA
jgi:membrane-associated protein